MKKAYFQYYETFETIIEKIKDIEEREWLRKVIIQYGLHGTAPESFHTEALEIAWTVCKELMRVYVVFFFFAKCHNFLNRRFYKFFCFGLFRLRFFSFRLFLGRCRFRLFSSTVCGVDFAAVLLLVYQVFADCPRNL